MGGGERAAHFTYARQIPRWIALGYHVKLIFLALSSPEIAVARVALRVSQGGHDIPEAVIRRRFASGLKNFEKVYQPLVSSWLRFDNTDLFPRLLDWREE